MEFLRKENQELSAELRITMDTLSRMLNEYSTVFTKDADLGDIQVIGGESDADADQAVGPSSQPESFDEADMSAEGAESGVEPVAAGDTPSENRDAMFQDVTGAVANAVDHGVGTASAVGAVDAVDETLSKEDTDLSDDAAIIEQLVDMQDRISRPMTSSWVPTLRRMEWTAGRREGNARYQRLCGCYRRIFPA